jgi:sulfatase modifying factor 1
LIVVPAERITHMSRSYLKALSLGLAALACLLASPALATPITIDMVTVGNPGNGTDPATGSIYGRVDYSYQIGTYSVTIGQYTAFLNAADPSGANPNDIYNASMGTDLNIAGISYTSGASTGAKYSVMSVSGSSPFGGVTAANRPITYVSWFDAARFANWMANGQGNGSTENGTYDLANAAAGNPPAKNLINPNTNAAPTFYIPNENEWYKAAYFSPNYGGVGVAGYYDYATQSDSPPGNIIGSGTNQANYNAGAGYSVTQSASYSASQNYLTDVGAFSGSGSFYGTFDQSGNVYQWNDLNGTAGSPRGLRGGFWNGNDPYELSSSSSVEDDPSIEGNNIGFRLASPVVVPEPTTWVMGLAGIACGGWQMYRRRRAR